MWSPLLCVTWVATGRYLICDVGHWHNMIFLESHGEEQDGLTTLISVIEYHFRFLCDNRVVQSVRRVNFNVLDVYRIIYADAYTDLYSLDRARSLTSPGKSFLRDNQNEVLLAQNEQLSNELNKNQRLRPQSTFEQTKKVEHFRYPIALHILHN